MLRTAIPLSFLAALAACTDAGGTAGDDPNGGLLRDFLDGKFDGAGHPLNAKTIEAEGLCTGKAVDSGVALNGPCDVAIPEGATSGDLTVNVRLRVTKHASSGGILKASLLDGSDAEVAKESLTVSRLRNRASWIDLSIKLQGSATKLRLEPQNGATVEVDYVEVFPTKFGLVIGPGSGVLADSDTLTFEVPKGRKLDELKTDAGDLLPALEALLASGKATRTVTSFRTLIEVKVGDLLPMRDDVVELRVKGAGDAARVQIRKSSAACAFEGDATGKKVLITGFQPFPADGWHENVSAVAVTAMNPAAIKGGQVMKLVLPVEYDRAAAAIQDVIGRCAPDIVISFGQGGGEIALEQTAYNLQDTGEIAGGVPDNRGIIRGAAPIDEAAPATRSTLLPLAAIRAAMEAAGESPADSTDPGRYICNNVMFQDIAAMGPRGGKAGFIHLPYTTSFDDAVRARFGKVVEAAVQASVDAP